MSLDYLSVTVKQMSAHWDKWIICWQLCCKVEGLSIIPCCFGLLLEIIP